MPEDQEKPRLPRARITPKQKRERLALIERLWLSGTPEGTIRETLRQTYHIKTAFAKQLIKSVKNRIAAADPTDPNSAKARAIQMLLDTYALAAQRQRARGISGVMGDPDTRTMATIAATLAKLEGAIGPERIEHFGQVKVDVDSLASKLEALVGGSEETGQGGPGPTTA